MISGLRVCGVVSSLWFLLNPAIGADIIINIVRSGNTYEYRLDGQTTQQPVQVRVNDRVKWVNRTNQPHTATSFKTFTSQVPLFDTGDIASPVADHPDRNESPFIKMEQAIFDAGGGQPQGTVDLEYYCVHHESMSSKIVLAAGGTTASAQPARAGADARRVRRDITSLSVSELRDYRDAWRQAQRSAGYVTVCGNHDCPNQWCHNDTLTFLPWHREYLLRMEAVIGQPLHYWDWTSAESIARGIPRAYSDTTYIAADGRRYPNPLFSFRFSCSGERQTTKRDPDPSGRLASIAGRVQDCYRNTTYNSFNSNLDGPHGSLHVWVGQQMSNTKFAAYDPIFWAHHSNVDRQWASWQRARGPDPDGAELNAPLFGFNLRVRERLNIATLGYGYDRYDSMPTNRPGPFVRTRFLETPNPTDTGSAGVGKTFVPPPTDERAPNAAAGPIALFVKGVPDHPVDSYAVYVFVNQPNAAPEDATLENPHFAGYFGIFGHGRVRKGQEKHDKEAFQEVLTLFAGKKSLGEPIKQITLVVTGEGRAVVPQGEIPFDAVEIGRPGSSIDAMEAIDAAGEVFFGVSHDESYDAAYRNAVDQAHKKLGTGRADALISVEVLSVEGERGGIAGARTLKVTIRARLKNG